MRVLVLYGTESGNAEFVANDVAKRLSADHDVEVLDLTDLEPSRLDPAALHLVICSTYGDGELPYGAQPFYERLESTVLDLTGIRFALFGLGDTAYPETFIGGALALAEKLTELGAEHVADHASHNASGDADASEAAIEWCTGLPQLALAPAQTGA